MSSQPLNPETVEMEAKERRTKRPMSFWWPVGSFATAVALFIIGGAIAGSYYRHGHCGHYHDNDDWDDDYDNDWDDDDCKGPKAKLYAAGAILLAALLVGLVCVTLFVVWLIKRRRAQQGAMYQGTPLNDYGQYPQPQPMYPQQYDPYAPPFAGKPPAYPVPYDAPPPQNEGYRSAESPANPNPNPFEVPGETHQHPAHQYGPPPATYH